MEVSSEAEFLISRQLDVLFLHIFLMMEEICKEYILQKRNKSEIKVLIVKKKNYPGLDTVLSWHHLGSTN